MYTSIYQPPSTTTSSPYTSYLYGNGGSSSMTTSAYETTPKYSTVGPSMASSYLNDLNSFSSTDPTTSSHRPYVSAIRKRRTLFADSDLIDSPGTPTNGTDSYSSSLANGHHHLFTNENYCNNQEGTSSDNKPNLTGFGFSHARNRPLSVVNEDAAAAAAALNNTNNNKNNRESSGIVTLNRSLTFNDASFVKSNNSKNENNNNNTAESSKPATNSKSGLRKSHSVNSPKSATVESSKPPTVASTPRTTVFDRLAQGTG